MRVDQLLEIVLLILCAACANGFVYSCNEVKYKLTNTDFEKDTDYACVGLQEEYTNWNQLKQIYIHAGDIKKSFADVTKRERDNSQSVGEKCIKKSDSSPWKIVADAEFTLNCTEEITLIFKSVNPNSLYDKFRYPVQKKGEQVPGIRMGSAYGPTTHEVFIVPATGMWLHLQSCMTATDRANYTGNITVTLWTGSGLGEAEESFRIRSWQCGDLPIMIFSFDNTLTVYYESDPPLQKMDLEYVFEYSSNMAATVSPVDKLFIFSNGRSDDLQNLEGGSHKARIKIGKGDLHSVTINSTISFDPSNDGSVLLTKSSNDLPIAYRNGIYAEEQFNTGYFEVEYSPRGKRPEDIGKSLDNIMIDITIGDKSDEFPVPQTTTTTPITTTTMTTMEPTSEAATTALSTQAPMTARKSLCCNCDVDALGFPIGWKHDEIWLDIVVILDTSESMGEVALDDAGALIQSFVSSDSTQFLNTDPTKEFYTRIGVISMADNATILYDLNMMKDDKVQGKASIKKGVTEINVVDAFEAALQMFHDGWKRDREDVRQVIYYMTASDAKNNPNGLNQFKSSQGVIIVNNFLQEGEVEQIGLKELASEGYYFSNDNYHDALQSFCKANCFCKPDKNALGGADIAIKASGGCYHPAPVGVPFAMAKSTCALRVDGMLAVIHDKAKEEFLQKMLSKARGEHFWIGLEKSNEEDDWQWTDGEFLSNATYTNWDDATIDQSDEFKCVYVSKTTAELKWSAGNCLSGFHYVCQYTPCSVGYKDC